MNEPESNADDWLHVVDGQPLLEPKLPSWHLCGGLQTPYYPNLSDQQLEMIVLHPEVMPSAAQAASRQLGTRGKPT